MLGLNIYHFVVIIIFALGIYNITLSKNIVKTVLIIEMMLGAVNLILFQISRNNGNDPLGQSVLITSIVIGAGLSAFLLSLSVKVYREFNTLDLEEVTTQEVCK